MAMTYSTLVAAKTVAGSIKAWVNDTTLDPDTILTDAQQLIYGQLRVREMRATATVSLTSGQSTAALPTRFMEPITRLYDITPASPLNCFLAYLPEENLIRQRAYSSPSGALITTVPGAYTIVNELFEFDCLADQNRSYSLAFYQRPAALAATTAETNFLTDRYPLLLRTACTALAFDFRHDDANYQRAVQRLTALITSANVEADFSRATEGFENQVYG